MEVDSKGGEAEVKGHKMFCEREDENRHLYWKLDMLAAEHSLGWEAAGANIVTCW